jgi:hypothetical protein
MVLTHILLQDARFAENATTYSEYHSSYTAYIDSESAFREAVARKTTAEQAVTYAQGEYDKYSTAVDAGEKVTTVCKCGWTICKCGWECGWICTHASSVLMDAHTHTHTHRLIRKR